MPPSPAPEAGGGELAAGDGLPAVDGDEMPLGEEEEPPDEPPPEDDPLEPLDPLDPPPEEPLEP